MLNATTSLNPSLFRDFLSEYFSVFEEENLREGGIDPSFSFIFEGEAWAMKSSVPARVRRFIWDALRSFEEFSPALIGWCIL